MIQRLLPMPKWNVLLLLATLLFACSAPPLPQPQPIITTLPPNGSLNLVVAGLPSQPLRFDVEVSPTPTEGGFGRISELMATKRISLLLTAASARSGIGVPLRVDDLAVGPTTVLIKAYAQTGDAILYTAHRELIVTPSSRIESQIKGAANPEAFTIQLAGSGSG